MSFGTDFEWKIPFQIVECLNREIRRTEARDCSDASIVGRRELPEIVVESISIATEEV